MKVIAAPKNSNEYDKMNHELAMKDLCLMDASVSITTLGKENIRLGNVVSRQNALISILKLHLNNFLDQFEGNFNEVTAEILSIEELEEYQDAAKFMELNFGRKNNLLIAVHELIQQKGIIPQKRNNLFDNFRNLRFE